MRISLDSWCLSGCLSRQTWTQTCVCLLHSAGQQMAGSCCDFTVLPFFSGIQAGIYIYTITTSFTVCCQQAKNHITLSHTHISTNNLNQHFFWAALGDTVVWEVGCIYGGWLTVVGFSCSCGLKYLSKYSPLTLPCCLNPAGRDFGSLHHSLSCQQSLVSAVFLVLARGVYVSVCECIC